jgi:hypothetical protein
MAMELQGMPDLQAYTTMETSSLDLAAWQVDRLFDGIPELPIPQQDLALAARMANQGYLIAYRLQAPEWVLANFDAFVAHAKALMDAANPPAPVTAPINPAALNPAAAAAMQLAGPGGAPPMPGGPAPGGPMPGPQLVAA